MPVTSAEDRRTRTKSTAIVSGAAVEEFARHTVRWTSIGVLAISFVGAIMAFNGRWPTTWSFWTHIHWLAAVAGIVLQAFCTMMEWANRKKRLSPGYIGPLLLDIGSTYIGFATLLVPFFVRALERTTLSSVAAQVMAHGAVIVLSWWFAFYPELNLVED